MTKPNPTKEKRVKAWAVFQGKNLVYVHIGSFRPKRYYIGTWLALIEDATKVIPCTITYQVTKKK